MFCVLFLIDGMLITDPLAFDESSQHVRSSCWCQQLQLCRFHTIHTGVCDVTLHPGLERLRWHDFTRIPRPHKLEPSRSDSGLGCTFG